MENQEVKLTWTNKVHPTFGKILRYEFKNGSKVYLSKKGITISMPEELLKIKDGKYEILIDMDELNIISEGIEMVKKKARSLIKLEEETYYMSRYKNPDKKRKYQREYEKKNYNENPEVKKRKKEYNKEYQKKNLKYWRDYQRKRLNIPQEKWKKRIIKLKTKGEKNGRKL